MKRTLAFCVLVLLVVFFSVSCDILPLDEIFDGIYDAALNTSEDTEREMVENVTKNDDETEIITESECKTDETETQCSHLKYEEKQIVAPTCRNDGIIHVVCSDCGEILMVGEEEALAHTEGRWTVEKAPTLEQNGLKTTNCTVCGQKLREQIEKVGYAEGLGFLPNGDGTCSLESIGNCKEIYLIVPPTSPDGDLVVSVGEEAFYDFYTDYNIVSLTLPDTVEVIGNRAFNGLTELKEVTLPKGLKVIGDFAFGSCLSLESITIPEGVTDIGDSAFINCHGIEKWNIPASVERIGRAAFFPEKITEITVDPENQNYRVEGNCLIDSEGVLIVGYGDVAIPDGVKVIGKEAFAYNNHLSELVLPESVESIELLAFYNCSVTEIVIPKGVVKLSDSFCAFCEELVSVTIPKSVTEIERWAIDECPKLSEIVYMGSLYDWNTINIHKDNEQILSMDITYMENSPADAVRYYGRSTISGNAAYVYDMLALGLLANPPLEMIELDGDMNVTSDDLSLAGKIFLSDHPECFWWKGASVYRYNENHAIISISFEYIYTGAALSLMRAELEARVEEIVAGVPDGTVFEKAIYLHDVVAESTVYRSTPYDQNPYGALVMGEAVCNGYATAYQMLLQEAGIRAWTVYGMGKNALHAWNVVWMSDGACVYTDVTWDDQNEDIYHYYFNMSLEEIDDDHSADEIFKLPECNHTSWGCVDVDPDCNVLDDDSTAGDFVALFGDGNGSERKAQFFFLGESFDDWFNSNSSEIYSLLDCSGFSLASYGNEHIMTAKGIK